MATNYTITTPHAAVLVWNYEDRIGTENMTNDPFSSGVDFLDDVEPVIMSTLSCVSIETSKSKSEPVGRFQLVLAPYKNWVSTITAGSWCCILMSNDPITENDIKRANKRQVKMIGKIETVKVDTKMMDNGERSTLYYVTGVDWGHIFNNIIYVDNLIAGPDAKQDQGNPIVIALRKMAVDQTGQYQRFVVRDNLTSIMSIFGKSIKGFDSTGEHIGRIPMATYNFRIPYAMAKYFNFLDPQSKPVKAVLINKLLNLVTGTLKGKDKYVDHNESKGFLNPLTLQGQHTFWQVLMDNSNPILNEMFTEMRWNDSDPANNSLALTIYNRIKPFTYKKFDPSNKTYKGLKSYFQLLRQHRINDTEVISVSAATNWRDKYNFIEIKPDFTSVAPGDAIPNLVQQKCQTADLRAFEREGFRPLIMESKQFPSATGKNGGKQLVDWGQLPKWLLMMREWYFNTHRMFSGTIVIHGINEYIAVGDNIKFDAGLINPTPNMSFKTNATKNNELILAHVESVSHRFTVSGDGARNYITTINFVRGITVTNSDTIVGRGTLDKIVGRNGSLAQPDEVNTSNVISTSDATDPDPRHVKGT
jgi:hypothetical protein